MKSLPYLPLLLAAGVAAGAHAGAVDRSGQSTDILFEEGNYFRATYGAVYPDISGVQVAPVASGLGRVGADSGEVVPDYDVFGFAYKHDFGDGFEAAIVYDKPFGAEIDYGTSPYFAATASASLDSEALTALVKYTFPSNVSVFGGLRWQTLEAEAVIPYVSIPPPFGTGAPYSANGKRDEGYGYVVGVGYEIPDIAMRISLTYNSEIDFEIETDEISGIGSSTTTTDVTTPQSVNLEFQTGIAPDTLLFGGIRWADWTEFDLTPARYKQMTGLIDASLGNSPEGRSLVSYDDDYWTYTLGVGRAFTEAFSGAVTFTYEPQNGGFASNLGPTDGYFSVGLGGTYKYEGWEFSGGIRYAWFTDTKTESFTGKVGEFEDNTAVALGFEVGYRF